MNQSVKTSLLTKTKWAITGREEFANLVDSISGLVNELIAAFPAEQLVKKREELCLVDAVELLKTDAKAIELLEPAMGKDDEQLRDALEKMVAGVTHHRTVTFSGANNQGFSRVSIMGVSI